MAGVSKKTTQKMKQFSYDIVFDGALLSTTRGSLVIELIKYFLYERQQIPLPVDELRDHVAREEDSYIGLQDVSGFFPPKQSQKFQSLSLLKYTNVHSEIQNHVAYHSDSPFADVTNTSARHCGPNDIDPKGANSHSAMGNKPPVFKRTQDRKAKVLVNNLTKLFQSLQKAFEHCPEIEKVAVLLGGTVVSPKESYLINFPSSCPEADSLPLLTCKRVLFQQIISEDVLGTMRTDISPTSMTVLVLAPRSCPLKGFLPKQLMHSPRTGAVISLNFHCSYHVPVCHDLTLGDGDLELSGIVPLDHCEKDKNLFSGKKLCVENGENLENRVALLAGKEFEGGGPVCECEFQIRSRFSRLQLSADDESLLKTGLCFKNISSSDPPPRVCQLHRTYSSSNHQEVEEKCLNMLGRTSGPSFHGKVEDDSQKTFSDRSKRSFQQKQICQVSVSLAVKGSKPDVTSELSWGNTDCIWYQSPLVIKGFRNQDSFHDQFKHF